nr:MAG TPA: hypothetical protein [Caudoviricetes sp.]
MNTAHRAGGDRGNDGRTTRARIYRTAGTGGIAA